MLETVTTVEQVIENIQTYQKVKDTSSKATPSSVRHWYYLPNKNIAGPSRYIGYKNRTLESYAVEWGNGGETERALKKLDAFTEVRPGDAMYRGAYAAAARLLPTGGKLRDNARFHVLK